MTDEEYHARIAQLDEEILAIRRRGEREELIGGILSLLLLGALVLEHLGVISP